MEFDTSTLMLIFFILLLVVSIWKIYAFLPNKPLADDDTTQASQEELEHLLIKTLRKYGGDLTTNELFLKMTADEEFDAKHFWRFNHNRLNQLLHIYYAKHQDVNSIKELYEYIEYTP